MNSPRLLPDPPQTQTLASKTFSPPPLDGALTPPELHEWHLENSPQHRLFVLSLDNGDARTIHWPEAVRAIHTGVRIVRSIMGWTPGMKEIPVVAILAASGKNYTLGFFQLLTNVIDTISYFTMMMAIMRAGYIAFPISPRNSPSAVAHLISKVHVKHVFTGRDQSMINLGREALGMLEIQQPNFSKPKLSPIPLFEDLFLDSQTDPDDIPYEKKGPDEIVIYLHSSGMSQN